jgi:hypothetical protein
VTACAFANSWNSVPIRNFTAHPPVTLHVFSGRVELVDLQEYLASLDLMFESGHRIASVAEFTADCSVDRTLVPVHAEWFRQRERLIAEHWLGVAVVLRAPMLRFLMSSLMLLTRLPMRYRLVEETHRAVPWVVHWIETSGQRPPDVGTLLRMVETNNMVETNTTESRPR